MMKKLFSAGIAVICFFLLASCSSVSHSEALPNSDSIRSQQGKSISDKLRFLGKFSDLSAFTENGFYHIEPRNGSGYNIKYVDFASAKDMYLCSSPSCEHKDDTCNSWLPDVGGSISPFIVDSQLYISYSGGGKEYFTLFGNTALPHIDCYDLKGNFKKTLLYIEASDVIVSKMATDDTHLYILLQSTKYADTSSPQTVESIVKIDLANSSHTVIMELPFSGTVLADAIGRRLVLRVSQLKPDAKSTNDLEENIFLFDVDSCELSLFQKWDYSSSNGAAFDGIFYSIEYQTKVITQTDLVNAESKVISQNYPDAVAELPRIQIVDTGHMRINYVLPDGHNFKNVFSTVALSDGNFYMSKLFYTEKKDSSEICVNMDIVATFGDNYLICSGRAFGAVAYVDPTGSSVFFDYPFPQYSIINKLDYWQNNLIFIAVELLE